MAKLNPKSILKLILKITKIMHGGIPDKFSEYDAELLLHVYKTT